MLWSGVGARCLGTEVQSGERGCCIGCRRVTRVDLSETSLLIDPGCSVCSCVIVIVFIFQSNVAYVVG
jgi:hypothetical protein